jgi:prefoldin subunit 5
MPASSDDVTPEQLQAYERLVTQTLAPLLERSREAAAAARSRARARAEALQQLEQLAAAGGADGADDSAWSPLAVDVGAGFRVRAESRARVAAVDVGLGLFVEMPLREAAALVRGAAERLEAAAREAEARLRQVRADHDSAASGLDGLRALAAARARESEG